MILPDLLSITERRLEIFATKYVQKKKKKNNQAVKPRIIIVP